MRAVIRLAVLADAAAIAEIHVRSWQWAYRGQLPDAFLDTLSVERRFAVWESVLREQESEARVWVAEVDGVVVGFVSAQACRDQDVGSGVGEIVAIYLLERFTRQGIGEALITQALSFFRVRGDREAVLWVLNSNSRARGFYERLGWRADGAEKVEEQRGGVLFREIRYRLALRGEGSTT